MAALVYLPSCLALTFVVEPVHDVLHLPASPRRDGYNLGLHRLGGLYSSSEEHLRIGINQERGKTFASGHGHYSQIDVSKVGLLSLVGAFRL